MRGGQRGDKYKKGREGETGKVGGKRESMMISKQML